MERVALPRKITELLLKTENQPMENGKRLQFIHSTLIPATAPHPHGSVSLVCE